MYGVRDIANYFTEKFEKRQNTGAIQEPNLLSSWKSASRCPFVHTKRKRHTLLSLLLSHSCLTLFYLVAYILESLGCLAARWHRCFVFLPLLLKVIEYLINQFFFTKIYKHSWNQQKKLHLLMFSINYLLNKPHPTSFNTARQAKSPVLQLKQSMLQPRQPIPTISSPTRLIHHAPELQTPRVRVYSIALVTH